MSWEIKKLGDFVYIKTGKLDANASSIDGAYPFFTCSKEPLRINTYSYDCECVLVAGNGDLNVKYYQGKFDAYQRTYIVESQDNKLLWTRYLYYFLDTYLEKLREQSIGGVIKYIKLENLTDAKIPLPPLATQKRIAEILDAADALRRKDQELLKKYDELAQAIFIDMFGDPVKNEKGWDVKKLKCICKSINVGFVGVCEPFYTDKKDGVPLIRTGNLGEGFLKLEKIKYVTKEFHYKQKKSILQKNDILIARHGDNGKAVLYNADFPEANCLNIVILRLESTSNPIFITTLLNHDSLRKWISGKIGGATQKVINTKALYDVPVISVNIHEQNNFGNLIKFVENQKSLAFQELENVNSLFDSLIQKAFKAELAA